jgi:hypothetical protein
MDGRRFDQLSRAVDAAVTRRRLLGGLFGLTVGAVAVTDAGASGRQACLGTGRICWRDGQCCTGSCPTGRRVPLRTRNRCSCGSLATCGTTCVDTRTDTQHCGACGHACPAGWECSGGVCGCGGETEPPDSNVTICCEGAWIDGDWDDANCGACGVACDAGEACLEGGCRRSCTPPIPNTGTCGDFPPPACAVDVDGAIRYLNGVSVDIPNVRGCAEPGGAPCDDEQFCVMLTNTVGGLRPGYNGTGLCVYLETECFLEPD